MKPAFPSVETLLQEVDDILDNVVDRDAALMAISERLKERIYHYDWVGFYLVDDSGDHLTLGPYVGASTDHTRIPFGKGICGQVAESHQNMIIQDVNAEDNYLSCSIDVQSEIVIPIMKEGRFVGELDIDSHSKAPFTDKDTELLEGICSKLEVLFP